MYLPLYFEPTMDLEGFRHMLDTVGPPARRRALASLGRRQLAELFEAAGGAEPLTLEFFVPAGVAPLHEVIHNGKNSLPVFNHFQKRFCRPDAEGAEGARELWGYNEGSTRPLVGPGYFVARPADKGEIVVDYTCPLPKAKPASWPEIIPNSEKLGRFVWGGMKDYVRRVSEHASIGRAYRNDKPYDAWFVLCREDPPTP